MTRLPAHAKAARGLVLVPEGRQLFSNMTVDENLENGGRSPAADGYSDRLDESSLSFRASRSAGGKDRLQRSQHLAVMAYVDPYGTLMSTIKQFRSPHRHPVWLHGRLTSISVEAEFWEQFKLIVLEHRTTVGSCWLRSIAPCALCRIKHQDSIVYET